MNARDLLLAECVHRGLQTPPFSTVAVMRDLLTFLHQRTAAREATTQLDISKHLRIRKLSTVRSYVKRLKETLADMTFDGYQIQVRRPYALKLRQPRPAVDGATEVSLKEFAILIRANCALEGVDAEERTNRFRELLKTRRLPQHFVGMVNLLFSRAGIASFDEFCDQLADQTIEVEVMQAIAARFDIHPLLLDPLLSRPVRRDHLVLDLEDDFEDFSDADDKSRGTGCRYEVPLWRLAGSGVSFVTVNLASDGTSDVHEHPGDELVFVRQGSIEVLFEQTGVRTRLGPGEFMHYYAEQRHSAIAVQGRAELLIVRVFHVGRDDTRQAISRHLLDALADAGPGTPTFSQRALQWIRQVLPNYRARLTNEINDVLGFKRFLECCPVPAGLDVVGLSDGLAGPGRLTLAEISATYDIKDFLLAGFAQPAAPNVAVIREADFVPISAESLTPELVHRVPSRNLSFSDISIAKATLKPSAGSQHRSALPPIHNHHPGSEAILMLRGELELYYEGQSGPVGMLAADGGPQLCHFDSNRRHWVENGRHDMDAEFFVIRFYRDELR
jgi:quercetin dioxygenase-like cupin family protein